MTTVPPSADHGANPQSSHTSSQMTYRELVEHARSTGDPAIRGLQPGEWKQSAPRVKWLIDGILPTPALTLIHSSSKAGKTTMLGDWLRALSTGEDWAGHKARKTRVLYLSEENASSHGDVVDEVGLADDAEVFFYSLDWRPDNWEWSTFMVNVGVAVLEHQADVLVIDTLGSWIHIDDMAAYGGLLTLMKHCRRIAHELGISLILTHHSRKMGGNDLDTALGSVAIVAGPDHLIHYQRKFGETVYTLKVNSRFRGARKSISIVYEDGVSQEVDRQLDKPKRRSVHEERLPLLFGKDIGVYLRHAELVERGAALDPALDKNKVNSALKWGMESGECVTRDGEGRYSYLPSFVLTDD